MDRLVCAAVSAGHRQLASEREERYKSKKKSKTRVTS